MPQYIYPTKYIQAWCATAVDEDREVWSEWGYCGPDCPIEANAWITDDTLKVTHHKVDQKATMIALKLLGIMSFSLLLIALMVKVLGISAIWFCKYVNNHCLFSHDDLQNIEEP